VSTVEVGEPIEIRMLNNDICNISGIIFTLTRGVCHQAVVEIDKFVVDDILKFAEDVE
jgi:hypothetical protein